MIDRAASRLRALLAGRRRFASAAAAQEAVLRGAAAKPSSRAAGISSRATTTSSTWEYYPTISRGRFELRPRSISIRFATLAHRGARDLRLRHADEHRGRLYEDNYISRGRGHRAILPALEPRQLSRSRAGAFGMPLVASRCSGTATSRRPGAAAAWESWDGAWSCCRRRGFYGPQHYHDDSHPRRRSGRLESRRAGPVPIEAAAAYWSFDMRNLEPRLLSARTPPRSSDGEPATVQVPASLDLLVRLRFPARSGAVTRVSSTASATSRRRTESAQAFEGALVAGQVGTPGSWRASYAYSTSSGTPWWAPTTATTGGGTRGSRAPDHAGLHDPAAGLRPGLRQLQPPARPDYWLNRYTGRSGQDVLRASPRDHPL